MLYNHLNSFEAIECHLQGQWLLKSTPIYIIIFVSFSFTLSRIRSLHIYSILNGVIYVVSLQNVSNIFCLQKIFSLYHRWWFQLVRQFGECVFSVYKCNCNRIKYATYFFPTVWTIYVNCRLFTHNDKLFPLTDVTKKNTKRKWNEKNSLKIVELNCIENWSNGNGTIDEHKKVPYSKKKQNVILNLNKKNACGIKCVIDTILFSSNVRSRNVHVFTVNFIYVYFILFFSRFSTSVQLKYAFYYLRSAICCIQINKYVNEIRCNDVVLNH